MKIALGTVQFGMTYGIANKAGQASMRDAAEILALARQSRIDTVDTAIAYGESEQRLGRIGVDGLQVISKLSAVPEEIINVREWVLNEVQGSLSRLKLSSLDGLLLHRPEQLLGQKGRCLYNALMALKETGVVKKVGLSIYSPSELDAILTGYSFDIIQAPMNVLDRRIIESGWAKRLSDRGIVLHTRSAFLQGLLLMHPQSRPDYFNKWDTVWHQFDEWVERSGRSALELCIRFVCNTPFVDKVIVGVEQRSQLTEILVASGGHLAYPAFEIGNVDENLLNPSLWRTTI